VFPQGAAVAEGEFSATKGGHMAVPRVFHKLQLKDQRDIVVLDAPASFEKELKALKGVRVHRDVTAPTIDFALAFVLRQPELDRYARALARRAVGDAVIWFAYPKASSKRYQTELSRGAGWQVLGDLGFETVRMIAIDEDWSAKRFRRPAFIKTMKRDSEWAMSKAGKAKTRERT
jgi:hypothetical protein